jgi:hypothetical protein
VFNGGAWLNIAGRRVDVHYRDLDVIEYELKEAAAGRFRIEPLMFHLAGIPTYLILAELAVNTELHGSLPRPEYPPALQASAPAVWWRRAEMTLNYALGNHVPYDRTVECIGLIAQASCQTAHAVLASRAEWITNEKHLLDRAGLRQIDQIVCAAAQKDLRALVNEARQLCSAAAQNGRGQVNHL